MVELTAMEKEIWDHIRELPVKHKDYMTGRDMKRIQNKRKLLAALKSDRWIEFYYHVTFSQPYAIGNKVSMYGDDDPKAIIEENIGGNIETYIKKITFTGKWDT